MTAAVAGDGAGAQTEAAGPDRSADPLRTGAGAVLLLVSLLGSTGFGLYQAGSAVYFVREAGLSPTLVGTCLSVAGLAGLFAGLPVGRFCDRYGPKRVAVVMAVARTPPLLGALAVHAFWQALVVILFLGVGEAGWWVSEEAMIARLTDGAGRLRIASYLRAVFNVGLTLGSLGAGIALAVGTPTAYRTLIWAYIATSVIGAALYTRLPAMPGRAAAEPAEPAAGAGAAARQHNRALRDLPFLAVACVSCLTVLGDILLGVGLPLWIIGSTSAPRSLAAWLMGVNAVLVVALQVRVSRAADTMPGAIRSQQWALALMGATCVLAGLAGPLSAGAAAALLVVAVLALTGGEMSGQAARWTMRFSLAPASAQGEYGAAFRLGLLAPRVAGPVLVTALTSHLHLAGWLVLAALFGAAIALTRPVTDWAVRTRPSEASMSEDDEGAVA